MVPCVVMFYDMGRVKYYVRTRKGHEPEYVSRKWAFLYAYLLGQSTIPIVHGPLTERAIIDAYNFGCYHQ